jgi:hypothetical protein
MSAIDQSIVEQLKQIHHELSMLDEPLPNPENFVADYWSEEVECLYSLGCPDSHDRRSFIFMLHACRSLNAGEYARAADLLQIALENINAAQPALEEVQAS